MIEFEIEDRVGRVLIQRPLAGNAFTRDMMRGLLDIVQGANAQMDILSIEGAGDDFTIGRDRQEPKSQSPIDDYKVIVDLSNGLRAFQGIIALAVQGRVHGFGVNLVLRADVVLASETARFALDEVKLGFPPMFVMEEILQHLPPKQAMDLVLTSREVKAAEALGMGLVSRAVAHARLRDEFSALVRELRGRNVEAVTFSKRYMRAVSALPPERRSDFAFGEVIRYFANLEEKSGQKR